MDAVALDQKQLDQIPQHRLTTWFPDVLVDDYELSHAYRQACEAEYPSNFLSCNEGSFTAALTAENRRLMSSVVYIRMSQNKVLMDQIEDVVRKEVRHRIDLETFDLHPTLYRRKTLSANEPSSKTRRTSKRPPRKKSKAHEKSSENQHMEVQKTQEASLISSNRLNELLGS